jgi:uncharacterized membrane protein YfcA
MDVLLYIVMIALAVLAAILMLIPHRGTEDHAAKLRFNKLIAVGSAFVVGIVSGVVGTGGAFVLIPIMLTVLNIPTDWKGRLF